MSSICTIGDNRLKWRRKKTRMVRVYGGDMGDDHIALIKKSLNPLSKSFHMTAVETAVTLKLKAELDDDLNELVFDSGGKLYVNEEWCFKIQLLRHLKSIASKG